MQKNKKKEKHIKEIRNNKKIKKKMKVRKEKIIFKDPRDALLSKMGNKTTNKRNNQRILHAMKWNP